MEAAQPGSSLCNPALPVGGSPVAWSSNAEYLCDRDVLSRGFFSKEGGIKVGKTRYRQILTNLDNYFDKFLTAAMPATEVQIRADKRSCRTGSWSFESCMFAWLAGSSMYLRTVESHM